MPIKPKEFQRTMLRIDPMLAKVHAYIPGEVNPQKAIVEKDVTNNFVTMLLSWLIIKTNNLTKPVVIYDGERPAWEITIKKL
jgi:hypothetical protein